MNILILQNSSFNSSTNSFSWFYTQIVEWLNRNGYKSELYYAYLKVSDIDYDNGLLLPDKDYSFYTPNNIKALSAYINKKQINVILDYSHIITGKTKLFFECIKNLHPDLKIFTMIHSCPNHTIQLKRYVLSQMKWSDVNSAKKLFQYLFPKLYLTLLKTEIHNQNLSAYKTLDEIVLLSPSYIPEFKKIIGKTSATRISSIPNALRPISNKIPINEKEKKIIFVGRIEPEKAIPKLLQIWKIAYHRIPEWELIIVGNDSQEKEMHQIIRQENIKNIVCIGHQMSLPYIDCASILCLTSVIEGFPTVFTEAMSLGVIPIGFNSFSAISDIIDHGNNGYIIPEGDYQQYADKLCLLATNNKLRLQMAQNAQNSVRRYTIDRVGPLWLETFKKHNLV